MTFSKSEVNDKNSTGLSTEHEVAGLYVTMDKATLVYLLNRCKHLDKDLNYNFEGVVCLETASSFRKINSHQVHHDQILF